MGGGDGGDGAGDGEMGERRAVVANDVGATCNRRAGEEIDTRAQPHYILQEIIAFVWKERGGQEGVKEGGVVERTDPLSSEKGVCEGQSVAAPKKCVWCMVAYSSRQRRGSQRKAQVMWIQGRKDEEEGSGCMEKQEKNGSTPLPRLTRGPSASRHVTRRTKARTSITKKTMFVPLPVPFVFQRTAPDLNAWRLKSPLALRSNSAPACVSPRLDSRQAGNIHANLSILAEIDSWGRVITFAFGFALADECLWSIETAICKVFQGFRMLSIPLVRVGKRGLWFLGMDARERGRGGGGGVGVHIGWLWDCVGLQSVFHLR
uniref:Uncharacterized protein n=1 Tax=Knipowitschia caucasica TaxID=637954 RepID=A0AAV2MBU9_KNICA